MNEKQLYLLKMLEIMESATLILDDGITTMSELSTNEIKDVIKEHKKVHGQCDFENMRGEAFNFEGAVNGLIVAIESRLE